MQTIVEYARREGLKKIDGLVLNENATMLRVCGELGFAIALDPNEADVSAVSLDLTKKAASS